MLNEREMKYRLACAQDQGVPMTNYGIPDRADSGNPETERSGLPEIAKLLE